MASIFSENLKIYNAEQFKKSVSDQGPTNIYLTIGKVRAWSNDAAPPQANSSVGAFNDVWQNMIAAKLISGGDVRHGIRRIDWSANTEYNQYHHCTCSLLYDSTDFYVLTTDWNIYKCLSNAIGSLSTVMPTQTITDASVEEQDGYIWKYMYTLTAEERIRFLTNDHMPVKTLLVDNNTLQWQVQDDAKVGSIDIIRVDNVGSGYTNANSITVTITGDGTGASARAKVNTISNTISAIIMVNHGLNYTTANVSISDTGSGVGAEASVVFPPPGGHGSDAMRELGGSYLILNPRLKSSEDGKISINNEYRQIAIIQDPIVAGTGNVASNTTYSQVLRLTMSPGSIDFLEDEYVYQGGSLATATFKGLVVDFDTSNNILQLTDTFGDVTSSLLQGANSGAARFVESITEKELRPYSGNLLYIDQISPIERAADQTEDYKIVLKF
jgi:hypothetical protein